MSAPDYGFWSRLLHRIALGNRFAAEMSFDIEKLTAPKTDRDTNDEAHVFVAGLARAGTTILMREIYATDQYRSLTYRDMPFPLAPNLWTRLSQSGAVNKEAEERAHGDGILVDFDSPEALEEVFWRVHSGASYIRDDRLVPMQPDQDVEAELRDYVSLLLRAHPDSRYLSKNNNNILRLGTLARCFPSAVIIVPFREPSQHARSLLRQHRLFRDTHASDSFARDYMTWLVHHEFGMDHRPFIFDEKEAAELALLDPAEDLDYWLALWIATYRYLLKTAPDQSVFVAYERLCNETGTVWPLLTERLGLATDDIPQTLRPANQDDGEPAGERLGIARELYDLLCVRGI